MEEFVVIGYIRNCWKSLNIPSYLFPSTDLLQYVVIWFSFLDYIDPQTTHQSLKIRDVMKDSGEEYQLLETGLEKHKNQSKIKHFHAFGTDMVQNGERKIWKFRMKPKCNSFFDGMIGIVEAQYANKDISVDESFVFPPFSGYGVTLPQDVAVSCIHEIEPQDDESEDSGAWADLFNNEIPLNFTDGAIYAMELDLTGIHGVLKYNQHIAFDDININKKYKLAIEFTDTITLGLIR
eukprot:497813_1